MEVKEASARYVRATGYKQTEVGVIPEDWGLICLSQLGVWKGGATPSMRNPAYWEKGNIPWVSSGDVKRPLLNDAPMKITIHAVRNSSTTLLPVHSILIVTRSGILRKYLPVAKNTVPLAINQDVKALIPNETYVSDYLLQLLQWSGPHILASCMKSGTTVESVEFRWLKSFAVPLPPTKAEQEAIAEALSDADALIESLSLLLAKKRHLKQGAMQELLTGKKRLPGFSGEWDVKTFNEVCWFQEGPGVRNTQFTTSGVKLLNGTNIFRGVLKLDSTSRFISEREAYGAYAHFLADAGDIVIASSGITIERFHEKVAYVRAYDLPFCMNTSTIRFKPFARVLASDFLFQYLTSDSFKRAIGGQATGSAQMNFGPSHVAKVSITLPEYSEQTAIATILSDMDAELAALEAKLAKARRLKQGMMQELLTGRIRLV